MELCLVADLGGEGLVASYVEVSSASDFVGGHAFASFDVTKNSNFRHRSLALSSVWRGRGSKGVEVWTWVEMRKVKRNAPIPILIPFRTSVPTLIPSFPVPKPPPSTSTFGQPFGTTLPKQLTGPGYAIPLNFSFHLISAKVNAHCHSAGMKQNRNSFSYLPSVTPRSPHIPPWCGSWVSCLRDRSTHSTCFCDSPIHIANEGSSTHSLEHPQAAKSHLLPLRPYVFRVCRDCFNIERSPLPC